MAIEDKDEEALRNAPDLAPLKKDLRREIRKALRALPREQFVEEGKKAAGQIRRASLWKKHHRILLFLSTDLEIDTESLISAALEENKEVFVPDVQGDLIRFYRINSALGPWRLGPFNIRSPITDGVEPLNPGEKPFLMVVPGLAFDFHGKRLGQGGGFYDRFFASLDILGAAGPGFYNTLGICLDLQLKHHIPVEPWDRPVDALCTGTTYREFKR
jgi:5-formyltetrahydrofolate cyclo-ligase